METAKIATQKKIGMANPHVQKIGNVKMWELHHAETLSNWRLKKVSWKN